MGKQFYKSARQHYVPEVIEVEHHPFETCVVDGASQLIIGTFPTHRSNYTFEWYYSGKANFFWKVIEAVYRHRFEYHDGRAIDERRKFLSAKGIGITDIISKCYRTNSSSSDVDLFPIELTDIFAILREHKLICRLVLTSRSGFVSAMWLLRTYFIQQGTDLNLPLPRKRAVLKASFEFEGRNIEIAVPYSTSPKLINQGHITFEELVEMYRTCLLQ